ncbi:unnamed protein product [Staurois parvus]|uniref:Uncharacterized protein n=1 Tax=Staurois parvus TaxID=386267 RepID=A0ABN9GDI5_9NEOB|nr:unnamed protein product [Staurois parvus]
MTLGRKELTSGVIKGLTVCCVGLTVCCMLFHCVLCVCFTL